MDNQAILNLICELGAKNAAELSVDQVPFNPAFRDACAANSCGNWGKSWMCPPDVGDIEDLIAQAKTYSTALVYQTVGQLEDSYDFEGMMLAGQLHNQLATRINEALRPHLTQPYLHLGAGGCRMCPQCSKLENLPCRRPEDAMSSLEAYGISVSELAGLCRMNYIHGANTVTYFGALLLA